MTNEAPLSSSAAALPLLLAHALAAPFAFLARFTRAAAAAVACRCESRDAAATPATRNLYAKIVPSTVNMAR